MRVAATRATDPFLVYSLTSAGDGGMGTPKGISSTPVASLDNYNCFWQTFFSMKSPIPHRSLDTRRVRFRPMILVCIGIPLVVGVSWLSVRLISDKTLLKKLPLPPNPADLHQSTCQPSSPIGCGGSS